MLHVICATLVFAVALAEMTEHAVVEQAAAGAALRSSYQARN